MLVHHSHRVIIHEDLTYFNAQFSNFCILSQEKERGAPSGAPRFSYLAAAAVIITAAIATVIAATQPVVTAAVAEEDDQQNDPAEVATAETVIVTHRNTSKIYWRLSRSFHGIPLGRKCAADRDGKVSRTWVLRCGIRI